MLIVDYRGGYLGVTARKNSLNNCKLKIFHCDILGRNQLCSFSIRKYKIRLDNSLRNTVTQQKVQD